MCQKEVSKEIWKYLELNENENTTHQNMWDAVKAILRGELMSLMLTLEMKKGIKWIT